MGLSPDRVKPKNIKLVFVASPLSAFLTPTHQLVSYIMARKKEF
jgi:hypothetical protein